MTDDALPLRRDGQLDTRPMQVEEWLEALPYTDFERTSNLLHQAISAGSRQTLKPATRQQLLELYDQPYRYYLHAQINTGARHTQTSMEAMQQQLRAMRQLAIDLAEMTQHLIDAVDNNRSLWGRRPPVAAVTQAIGYWSQTMIFSFLEYRATPAGIWQRLHRLYQFAESLELQQQRVTLADGRSTSINNEYCRILLTEAVDPYHLPFGAIWEIYEQVDAWLADNPQTLQDYRSYTGPGGLFIVALDSDTAAIPANRFKPAANTHYRLLDAGPLHDSAGTLLAQLAQGQHINDLKLSQHYQRLLLEQMSRAWNLPPRRHLPRAETQGELGLSSGLAATHIRISGRDLLAPHNHSPRVAGLQVDGEMPSGPATQATTPGTMDTWQLLNKSAGGCALSKTRPQTSVRVGDLAGLRLMATDSGDFWRLGIIRWLMVDEHDTYRMGLQLLGGESQPVILYCRTDGEPQRGFYLDCQGESSIIAPRGLLRPQQGIEMRLENDLQTLRILQRIEQLATCERFSVQPQ